MCRVSNRFETAPSHAIRLMSKALKGEFLNDIPQQFPNSPVRHRNKQWRRLWSYCAASKCAVSERITQQFRNASNRTHRVMGLLKTEPPKFAPCSTQNSRSTDIPSAIHIVTARDAAVYFTLPTN